jgi:hypothetical protein
MPKHCFYSYCKALSGVCRDGDYLEILYVVSEHNHKAGLATKNPPKKSTRKNPKKTSKNPLKMDFWFFFNFKFFLKIIQTFLFETDFL